MVFRHRFACRGNGTFDRRHLLARIVVARRLYTYSFVGDSMANIMRRAANVNVFVMSTGQPSGRHYVRFASQWYGGD